MKRISYYEGTRTFFCMLVIVSHIFMAFYPDAPKQFVSMGNLAVIYFFFLSGGVLGLSTYKGIDKRPFCWCNIINYVIKRYFRLLPVVAISLLISTFIYRVDGYACQELSQKFELNKLLEYFPQGISEIEGFYDAFVGAFYRRPRLNAPLWTIRYEFLGSIFVYIIMKLFCDKKCRMYIYPLLICLLLFLDIYVASMYTGMVLFDLLYSNKERSDKIKCVLSRFNYIIIMLIMLTVVLLLIGKYAIYFRYALTLELMLLIFSSETLQRGLSNKVFVRLSKYTFSVYATHWLVICSVVAGLINICSEQDNYMIVSIVISIICIPIIWGVGALMYILCEKPAADMIYRIIKKRNKK